MTVVVYKKRAPSVDHEKIAMLTAEGWSAEDIAKVIGCCVRTVVRSRNGESPKPPGRVFSVDEIFQIEEMLDDGCSYTEIGRTVGRDATVIAHRWPGRGWSPAEAGDFRRFTQKLERAIAERWPALEGSWR